MFLRAFDAAVALAPPEPRDPPSHFAQSAELATALKRALETIAMAKASTSAAEARSFGLLAPADRITMNRDRLLLDAKAQAAAIAESGYAPPQPRTQIPAPGIAALATLEMGIYLMGEAGYASEHDQKVARWAAYILAGGRITPGSLISEQYFLDLEREAFLSLCGERKSKSASPSLSKPQAAAELNMKPVLLMLFTTAFLARNPAIAQDTIPLQAQLVESGQIIVDGHPTPFIIRHLPVSSFPDLPPAIQQQLDRRGCLIPQTYEAHGPENVVHCQASRARALLTGPSSAPRKEQSHCWSFLAIAQANLSRWPQLQRRSGFKRTIQAAYSASTGASIPLRRSRSTTRNFPCVIRRHALIMTPSPIRSSIATPSTTSS
ncbi:MAG: hypothetical protein WDM87_09560 [Terracidiphilus sp.]